MIREYCKNDETESKLQIRIYQKDDEGNVQFFHSKCYIFLGENLPRESSAVVTLPKRIAGEF